MASTTLKELPAVASSRRWAVDPRRSTVEFRVPTFWGLSTVVGHFDHFEGSYGRDDDDVPAIDLTIDAESLDTGSETRDRHLRSERFFDIVEHPQVRFSSTLIHQRDGTLAINGHLEAAGGRVPVALEATARKVGDELELEATTTVDQRDLGMTFSPLGMIRTPTTLHVKARLTPDRGQPFREPSRTYEYTRTRARLANRVQSRRSWRAKDTCL